MLTPANDNGADRPQPAAPPGFVPLVGVIVDGGRVLFFEPPPAAYPNDPREA